MLSHMVYVWGRMNARYNIRATLGPEIRLWEKENRLRQYFRNKRRGKKGSFGNTFPIVHFQFKMPGRAAFFLPLATTATALAFFLFAKKRNVLLLLAAEVLIHTEAADVQRQHKHQQECSELSQRRKRKDESSLFLGKSSTYPFIKQEKLKIVLKSVQGLSCNNRKALVHNSKAAC